MEPRTFIELMEFIDDYAQARADEVRQLDCGTGKYVDAAITNCKDARETVVRELRAALESV